MHKQSQRAHLPSFKSPVHSLILGQPWLFRHNPNVNWRTGKIMGWGENCAREYLDFSTQGKNAAVINFVSANSATDSEYPDLSSVPPCYHHLREVSLPPHQSYDYAIELIPGSTIPKGRLYSVSGPEREAMKDYIETSLKAGLIRPSCRHRFLLHGQEGRVPMTLHRL